MKKVILLCLCILFLFLPTSANYYPTAGLTASGGDIYLNQSVSLPYPLAQLTCHMIGSPYGGFPSCYQNYPTTKYRVMAGRGTDVYEVLTDQIGSSFLISSVPGSHTQSGTYYNASKDSYLTYLQLYTTQWITVFTVDSTLTYDFHYAQPPAPATSNLTINVKTLATPNGNIENANVSLEQNNGFIYGKTDIYGNVTFLNAQTNTTPRTINVVAYGYKDFTEEYTALTGEFSNLFHQVYLTNQFTPVCGWNLYNIKQGDTGIDVTNQVSVNEYYNGTWINETPTYYPDEPLKSLSYFIYDTNNFITGKPSLSDYRCAGNDPNGTIQFTLPSGYLPYTIKGLNGAGINYVVMTPNTAIPIQGKCSKVFSNGEIVNPTKIIINRFEVGFSEIITTVNHLAQSLNNNPGNYTFTAYDSVTNKVLNSGSFLCETGTNATGKTYLGVHSEFIYDADNYAANLNITPLPYRNVYVELVDANTGANIVNYDVSIKDDLNKWYNYTVLADLGKLTAHAYISDDRIITVYIKKAGYIDVNKIVILSGSGLDYNFDHIIKMSTVKTNSNGGITYWNIKTLTDMYGYPIPNVSIGIFSGIDKVMSGNTNNGGNLLINITNNTGRIYDVVGTKAGYKSAQQNDQLPNGANYETVLYLIPLAPTTTQPTPTPLPNVTPINNNGLSAGTCRLSLDTDNETIWSPFLNIEACVGIQQPIYQQYILACLTDIVLGLILVRKYKSVSGFIVGATIGNSLCALTGLVSWTIWIVVMIPLAMLFLYKGEK